MRLLDAGAFSNRSGLSIIVDCEIGSTITSEQVFVPSGDSSTSHRVHGTAIPNDDKLVTCG